MKSFFHVYQIDATKKFVKQTLFQNLSPTTSVRIVNHGPDTIRIQTNPRPDGSDHNAALTAYNSVIVTGAQMTVEIDKGSDGAVEDGQLAAGSYEII